MKITLSTLSRALASATLLNLACMGVLNAQQVSEAIKNQAAELREQALNSELAWDVLESLTTEVGPRLAGSPADAKAVAWGVAKFKELGFDKVWTEPVTIPVWRRIHEKAAIVAPFPQAVTVTALGSSVSTPKGGLMADIVHFA
ncbi:MAG: peptidase M28 family protein, partial [Paraglaciecola sp.]|nr:peptidase M28 family protein [Paraglaciecola sp.]